MLQILAHHRDVSGKELRCRIGYPLHPSRPRKEGWDTVVYTRTRARENVCGVSDTLSRPLVVCLTRCLVHWWCVYGVVP